MKKTYNKIVSGMALLAIAITGIACGQNAKVKTITIVNGDTTISEKIIGDKEIAEIEKQITMVISTDENSKDKKVIKKIIINSDDNKKDELAFAFSMNDEKDGEVEININEDGKEKKVIKKTLTSSINSSEKENVNLNISVKKGVIKLEYETTSKEAINVSILDESGKQIFYDTQKTGSKYSKEIKLEKKGTYFLNIIQNKKTTSDKIIVE